jgi:hypothetical protein
MYDKKCHIIRCTESISFLDYVGIQELWKDNINKEKQWTKFNIARNKSTYTEKDCFEKSQNYCSTGELQQN